MTSLAAVRYALSISVAATLLVACESRSPAGSPNPIPQVKQTVTRASGGTLLYASDGYNVDVFSYPKGSPVGQLSGFDSGFSKEGLCTDGAGDVFVAGYLNIPKPARFMSSRTVARIQSPNSANKDSHAAAPLTLRRAISPCPTFLRRVHHVTPAASLSSPTHRASQLITMAHSRRDSTIAPTTAPATCSCWDTPPAN